MYSLLLTWSRVSFKQNTVYKQQQADARCRQQRRKGILECLLKRLPRFGQQMDEPRTAH